MLRSKIYPHWPCFPNLCYKVLWLGFGYIEPKVKKAFSIPKVFSKSFRDRTVHSFWSKESPVLIYFFCSSFESQWIIWTYMSLKSLLKWQSYLYLWMCRLYVKNNLDVHSLSYMIAKLISIWWVGREGLGVRLMSM